MRVFLWLCLAAAVIAVMVPVETGSQRCLVIYSMNQEDTIKIGLKFPDDPKIQQIYDYTLRIKDLEGQVVMQERISTQNWRTEVAVPNQTIYEACIGVITNETRAANTSIRYRGEILVSYEANTHFVAEGSRLPVRLDGIREEEVITMKTQANQLINITRQFVELQRMQREEETREYEQKKQAEESIFQWWMLELLLIAGLGLLQWTRMKNKIQADRHQL